MAAVVLNPFAEAVPGTETVEIQIDPRTGEVVQAGTVDGPGAWVADMRAAAERSLYFYARFILGFDLLTESLHRPICDWLQHHPPYRKGLIIPRDHLKCFRASYWEQTRGRWVTGIDDGGVAVNQTGGVRTELGPRAPVYRVTTSSGRFVEVTANHPFLVWGGGWRAIDEGLERGQWVGVLRRGNFGDHHDPDRAEMVGWMLGDASIARQEVTIYDPDARQRFINLAAGLGYSLRVNSLGVAVHKMQPLWREWELFKSKSGDKFVPAPYLRADMETTKRFLRGLFQADATVRTGKTKGAVVYTTISERLAHDVQHLLVKFGLHAKLFRLENHDGRHANMPYGYEWFQVVFTDTEGIYLDEPHKLQRGSVMDRFPPAWREELEVGQPFQLRQAGIRVDNKYATTREKVRRVGEVLDNDYLRALCDSDVGWEEVVGIEYIGVEPVVSVETPTHNLCVGDIVTHNTTIVGRALPLHIITQPKENNIYFPGCRNPMCKFQRSEKLDKPECDNPAHRFDGVNTRILLGYEIADNAEAQLVAIENDILNNPLIQALWPHKFPASDREAVLWNMGQMTLRRTANVAQPTIDTAGIGAATTGRHYDVHIFDDLCSQKAAESVVVMNKCKDWFFLSRAMLDDPATSLEFTIGTHWDVKDLYVEIMEEDPSVQWVRRAYKEGGKVIFPERMTPAVIENKRKTFGKYFPLLFMSNPVDPALVDFDLTKVRYFHVTEKGHIAFYEDPIDAALQHDFTAPPASPITQPPADTTTLTDWTEAGELEVRRGLHDSPAGPDDGLHEFGYAQYARLKYGYGTEPGKRPF